MIFVRPEYTAHYYACKNAEFRMITLKQPQTPPPQKTLIPYEKWQFIFPFSVVPDSHLLSSSQAYFMQTMAIKVAL